MSKFIIFFVLALCHIHAVFAQIDVADFPEKFQFFARDKVTNTAQVSFMVAISREDKGSAAFSVFKNGLLVHTQTQNLNKSNHIFTFSYSMAAELSLYKFALTTQTKNTGLATYEADSLVAGDVYVLNGQSNAQTANSSSNAVISPFVRTFGRNKEHFGSANIFVGNDLVWSLATQGITSSGYLNGLGELGGLFAQKIISQNQMPVAIFNATRAGSIINTFMKIPDDPYNINTNYGRLMNRLNLAGVQNNVTGYIWYQGEAVTPNYLQTLKSFIDDLEADMPSIACFYVFQVCRNECNQIPNTDITFATRAAQNEIVGYYAHQKVQTIATSDIPHYWDRCHFGAVEYQEHALRLYQLVNRDIYGYTNYPTTINSPQITGAQIDPNNSQFIILTTKNTTDSLAYRWRYSNAYNTSAVTVDSLFSTGFVLYGAANDGIETATCIGNHIVLKRQNPSANIPTHIGYKGNLRASTNSIVSDQTINSPVVINQSNIGLLSFDMLPITP